MDTPTIVKYYKEPDPMKRKSLLEQSIAAGEEPEENAVRKELWEVRYHDASELGADTRADGYLGLWMSMEFNRGSAGKFFGNKAAVKELKKRLDRLKFREFQQKSELHRELLYKECCHMVRIYVELCKTDKSYNTVLCGIMPLGSDNAVKKMKKDIYETAVLLPEALKMEEDLGIITRAAREVYEEFFPDEGGMPQ